MANALVDLLQSASNSAADTVGAPVDALAWLLRKAGVPVPDNPMLGTKWQEQAGLRRPVAQGAAQVAGETLGLLAPTVAAAKAPQIAAGLLQAQRNAALPRTMRPDAGAIVWHGTNADLVDKILKQGLSPSKKKLHSQSGDFVYVDKNAQTARAWGSQANPFRVAVLELDVPDNLLLKDPAAISKSSYKTGKVEPSQIKGVDFYDMNPMTGKLEYVRSK